MAFVSRSERKLLTHDTLSVGPGAYTSDQNPRPPPSFAPFSSTSSRDISKTFGKNFNPGPGTYTIPSVQSTGSLDHRGYVKYSPPFASHNERFVAKDTEPSPGPGSYLAIDSWNQPRPPPKSIIGVNWARIPSAPSIPGTHQSHGYDQTETGELVMQKGPEIVHSGGKNDCVGPGHYRVQEKQKSTGPKWHKSKSHREIYSKPTTGPGLGPGSYTESKTSIAPMYKLKQNAVFATKTTRETGPATISPGPGSYAIDKITAFAKKKLPNSLQNFGSTTNRFQESFRQYDVGPGYYSVPSHPGPVSQNGTKAPFCSTNNRFQYKTNTNPGPGTYEEVLLENNSRGRTQGVFGSTQERFGKKGSEEYETPGPGHYKPEAVKRSGAHNSAGKKQNAVFSSKVKRGEICKESSGPPPGAYEVGSAFVKNKTQPVLIHPILSKVNHFQTDNNVGFASSTERFSADGRGVMEVPGPGHYEVNEKKQEKRVIVATEERFKKKIEKEAPGPGSYYGESEEVWNKKSYNVLFSEII